MNMTAEDKAEQAEEREYRQQAHREAIKNAFRNTELPGGLDPFDYGLVIVYVKGGPGDYGRIHRANCRSVSNVANGSWSARSSMFAETNVDDRTGRPSSLADRCKVCGTNDREMVRSGASYYGETQESIAARKNAVKRYERLRDYKREREYAVSTAQRKAVNEVLEKYAAEVEALRQQYEAEAVAVVDSNYPDVAPKGV